MTPSDLRASDLPASDLSARVAFALVSLALLALAFPAVGQTAAPRTAPLPTLESQTVFAPETPPRPAPIPSAVERRRAYEAEARQLAEAMGAAHYLRWVCFGRQEQTWRLLMGEFLDREDQRLRPILAEAFNDGFDAERLRFDRCSPRAQISEQQWRERGLRLADGLSARLRD